MLDDLPLRQSDPIRILLIDDDQDDHVLVRGLIEDAFGDRASFHWEDTYAGGLDALTKGNFELCLLDYRLGARTGIDLLGEAHQRGVTIPTILLTGQSAREIDLAAAEAGAADYLVKGEITASLMERAIRYTLRHARVETDLRESEQRYRALVEHNPHAVYGFDLEGNFIAVNRATEWITGYSSEELLGRSFQMLIVPDDLHIAEATFRRTRDEHLSAEYELRIQHRAGHEVDLRGISVPQMIDGSVAAVYGTAQDITEEKRLRRRLAQREKEFETLAENAPDVIARLDKERRYLYANPVITDVTGVPRDDFIGRTNRELGMPEDIVHSVEATIDYVFETADQRTIELAFPGPQKGYFFQSHFKPEVGPDGSVDTLLCVSRDITELRETQDILERRERRFRTLAERSTEVLTLLDRTGTVLYKSPSVEPILGFDPDELTGEHAFVRVHPDDQPAAERALNKLVQTGSPGVIEYRHRHADGSWCVMSATAENLLDDPDVGAIVVHSRDVTEAKELEAQLRQSQKLEAVGQLAGGIAHDFNNVLTAIQGNAQMALMDADDGVKGDLEEIVNSSRRASDLTRQLLAFSRQQVLHPRVIDLRDVIGGMKGMLDRLIGEHIELTVSAPPQLGPVRADPSQVEQVVMNLAVNARDAMAGGGALRISLDEVELGEDAGANFPYEVRPGPYVRLSVRDEGEGMDGETLARLFEPFFTTKPPGKGTGLGLPTVYGIVKQSGGYIWVDSEVGKGTTVDVYLPRAGDDAPVEAVDRTSVAELDGDLAGEETVLVCEDQEPVRKLAQRALERHGYRVLVTGSGQEALTIAEQHDGPIHLVLTDVIMPKMGGAELADRLRTLRPGTKVLFMSGYARREIVQQGGFTQSDGTDEFGGIAEFIQKPFEPRALVARIRAALDSDGGTG
jgi:two-component system, cell cycle sensor histidine kinase and response regulator CckA